MKLKDLFEAASKAQLQGYFLHWLPGREVLSARERLSEDLLAVMEDPVAVRERFDSLGRSQQGFLVGLLVSDTFSGTVDEIRETKHGRVVEDFEIETVLKRLQESGYIVKTGGSGGYASEIFSIPEDLALALKKTIAVENRLPMQMLSLVRANNHDGSPQAQPTAEAARRRIEGLSEARLRALVETAIREHVGVLTHSESGEASLDREEWRRQLERSEVGTVGVLSLKDYGIGLEEQGLFVYQELVREISLQDARNSPESCDRELSLGVDLIIDLDRVLELIRLEPLEITREGTVYKKIEERIAGCFVTAQLPELHDESPMGTILDLSRRLHFFDEENQKIVPDPVRRKFWRKVPLVGKIDKVFELFRSEHRGQRWSFHQSALREIFLEQLRAEPRDGWLKARPFLTAAISTYLLSLEEAGVSVEYHERCADDFRHETVVVPFSKMYHDLSYWVVHRLALLGLVDIGYTEGSFECLRLSALGTRYFAWKDSEASQRTRAQDGPESADDLALEGTHEGEEYVNGHKLLVNPDFEILVYPETPEELNWYVSFFADRVDSDRVKRYRLTRESMKRGVVSGLSSEEILQFLARNTRGSLPPNVEFSLREWVDGVELVRRQKVLLLRATTPGGARRALQILERAKVPHERLNETVLMVRGSKNERAVEELQQQFRDGGLFVE